MSPFFAERERHSEVPLCPNEECRRFNEPPLCFDPGPLWLVEARLYLYDEPLCFVDAPQNQVEESLWLYAVTLERLEGRQSGVEGRKCGIAVAQNVIAV